MCVQGNHPEDPRSHSFILLFIFIKSNKPLKMLQVVEEKKINQTPSASKESDCSLFTVCWRQTSKCVLYRCCSMTGQQEARGNSQRRECGKRERGTKLAFFPPLQALQRHLASLFSIVFLLTPGVCLEIKTNLMGFFFPFVMC